MTRIRRSTRELAEVGSLDDDAGGVVAPIDTIRLTVLRHEADEFGILAHDHDHVREQDLAREGGLDRPPRTALPVALNRDGVAVADHGVPDTTGNPLTLRSRHRRSGDGTAVPQQAEALLRLRRVGEDVRVAADRTPILEVGRTADRAGDAVGGEGVDTLEGADLLHLPRALPRGRRRRRRSCSNRTTRGPLLHRTRALTGRVRLVASRRRRRTRRNHQRGSQRGCRQDFAELHGSILFSTNVISAVTGAELPVCSFQLRSVTQNLLAGLAFLSRRPIRPGN